MTCGNCGYRIPEDSEFCQYCGVRITGSPTPAAAPSPAPARKNSAPKKPRRTAWVALLVLVLVLLGGLVWFWAIPGMKYLQAKDQLNNGDYDGAYAAFCALGDFADAPQQSLEARYQKAVALRAQGDFDDANPIFRELLDYRDSSALIHEHNYAAATCTEPRTCKNCGATDGSALGHTAGTFCTRCGKQMESLVWQRRGSGKTGQMTLPEGTYTIFITYNGTEDFKISINRVGYEKGIIVYEFILNKKGPVSYTYELNVTKDARVENGCFKVETPDQSALWTVMVSVKK